MRDQKVLLKHIGYGSERRSVSREADTETGLLMVTAHAVHAQFLLQAHQPHPPT